MSNGSKLKFKGCPSSMCPYGQMRQYLDEISYGKQGFDNQKIKDSCMKKFTPPDAHP